MVANCTYWGSCRAVHTYIASYCTPKTDAVSCVSHSSIKEFKLLQRPSSRRCSHLTQRLWGPAGCTPGVTGVCRLPASFLSLNEDLHSLTNLRFFCEAERRRDVGPVTGTGSWWRPIEVNLFVLWTKACGVFVAGGGWARCWGYGSKPGEHDPCPLGPWNLAGGTEDWTVSVGSPNRDNQI